MEKVEVLMKVSSLVVASHGQNSTGKQLKGVQVLCCMLKHTNRRKAQKGNIQADAAAACKAETCYCHC